MQPLLIAVLAGIGFLVAYHTYGRWLGRRIFRLSAEAVCPSVRLEDGNDYVPTPKSVVFGHHFTSIAGTGPIVGPAIAVMWGWLPALLWVVFGSIFIGAVHDLGTLVVSLRNNGQTVGDIAGRVMNKRVRILFLLVLFMVLTIVLAVFGLVIANVFKLYPASIFPCTVQIPIAIVIGLWLHRRGVGLLVPSLAALAVMYLTVIYGDVGWLHTINSAMAAWPLWVWVVLLLVYSYIASVIPVWMLLQPRDYINSLQLLSALGLILAGLVVAAFVGGAPPVQGADRPPLELVAPMVNWSPAGAPPMAPFLFITIACGAISGFHCLVSSGTSSKQLKSETDARYVGFGAMLTEGFLAVLVILACTAGIGLGLPAKFEQSAVSGQVVASFTTSADSSYASSYYASSYAVDQDGRFVRPGFSGLWYHPVPEYALPELRRSVVVGSDSGSVSVAVIGSAAYATQYQSWGGASGLAKTVGAFVTGAGNFVNALGVPMGVAVALMGVLVASFAGTTMDTACRLQRYVIQELAAALLSWGWRPMEADQAGSPATETRPHAVTVNPLTWLANRHGATLLAIATAGLLAAMPSPGEAWTLAGAGKGGMILWPLFGATNQLLGGLAFMVVLFYLWRRGGVIWFLVLPMGFMLLMPAWAMIAELPRWISEQRWVLAGIAAATLALEAWMVVEAALMFPRARNVLESEINPTPRRGFEVVPLGQG